MRNKRSLIALIFFAVAALVLTSNSQAQGEYEKLSKASLKNLKGVPDYETQGFP
jgi:hypothetical protein